MENIGTIVARVFTSRAQLPISGAIVTFILQTEADGYTLLATRLTDENGNTAPVAIETPDIMKSMSPGMPQAYALVDAWVEHPDYARVEVRNIEVFSGVQSIQDIPMVPLNGSQTLLGAQESRLISGSDSAGPAASGANSASVPDGPARR